MKKRLLSILCVMVVALSATACNKAETTAQTTSETSAASSGVSEENTLSTSDTSSSTTAETSSSVTSDSSASEEKATSTTTKASDKKDTSGTSSVSSEAGAESNDETTKTVSATTTATTPKATAKTTVTTKKTAAKTTVTTTKKTSAKTTVTTKKTTTKTTVTTKKATVTTKVTEAEKPVSKKKLSNPNATKEAQALYDYICRTYREGIISGQQESTWMGSDQYEFDYIYKNTGKYPAIRGLDYMNDDFKGVNKRAVAWHNKGGIVTICWHCGSDFSGSWSESMNTKIIDWDKALTKGTPENKELIKGMDKAAAALKELKDKNIPVLWRPFHEFDGAWFWWGKGGAENFKKLWIMMYDRYTNYWGLDNLIWVLGYSGNGRGYENWYPGNEYVDIAGADSYNDGANGNLYKNVKRVVGDVMPICFHECGRIPTVEQLEKAAADWVWFMTWHTEYITDHNDTATLKKIYNSKYVITLDELPDLY